MSRIGSVFASRDRKALIAYLTVGYPSIEATLELVPALVAAGCDMVELGIPFSDPLADGTTIQRASSHSLSRGVTPQACLEAASRLREVVSAPLIFMSYYNPIFAYGLEPFSAACGDAGVDGLIIPDLPPEEGAELEEATQRHQLDLIYLLAPTSTEERIRLVAARSRGFIYLVSLSGVTGARRALPTGLEEMVARVRRLTTKPLCLGFGISTPEQARRAASVADGVIVGSRILEIVEASESPAEAVSSFVQQLRKAMGQGTRSQRRSRGRAC